MVPRKGVKKPRKTFSVKESAFSRDPLGTMVLESGLVLQYIQVMISIQITPRWSPPLLAGCLVSVASRPRREPGRAYPVSRIREEV